MSARRQIVAALAKARTAAIADLKQDNTTPKWRLIATDSESLTGLAPVCTSGRSDALHMIDDYPGGPKRDEEGVYDCCPWPQIETYSPVWAAYLVELLNADAGEKATASAATATPLTVYRASHDSIVMGHYTTREAAMDHVHATLANEEGGDVKARAIWRADDPEDDEPEWECWLFDTDMADDEPTGYVVTPVEVASKYEPEDDE
jgi:hypothetical protein